ncbi:hypothetical protein [Methanoregula sp.]|uniref:hypothetical protein n=1 Tax=Methanoregula sp. TaxID=2052170 RepID=UPI00236B602A|nr:hypothetical protein [Methanoregula sp.]MDD1687559.1 hypothetical protein [Methanoregula sp.]
MSDKNSPCILQKPDTFLHPLELAVPVLSLGGVLLAMLFSGPESPIDVRYFAAGCIISSFILAYLAWIRPRKDIVALTTPIYSFLFFVAPSDFAVNFVLELLYAVSLTILLIRLKMRFGAATEYGLSREKTLEEPLKTYCETISRQANDISPGSGHYAAVAFARFAQGDYRLAADVADAALAEMGNNSPSPVLATAFSIIREQGLLLEESAESPAEFIEFSSQDSDVLARSLPPANKRNDCYEVSLDNALLFLYAAAWTASLKDRPLLLTGQGFAQKLFAS